MLTSEAAACGSRGDRGEGEDGGGREVKQRRPGESEPDLLPEFCPLEIHERRIMAGRQEELLQVKISGKWTLRGYANYPGGNAAGTKHAPAPGGSSLVR